MPLAHPCAGSWRLPVPAAAWRLDTQALTFLKPTDRLGRKRLAVEVVVPDRTVLAAVGAGRRVATAFGDQAVLKRRQRFHFADHAVAAVVRAASSRVAAHGVLDHPERKLQLERPG